MVARIGVWQGAPEEMARWIVRAREQVESRVRRDPGLGAAYGLVDRDAGKGVIITMWESEAAMQASEDARARRQSATTAATGAQVTTGRYEVVDLVRPAPGGPWGGSLGLPQQAPEQSNQALERALAAPKAPGLLYPEGRGQSPPADRA